MGLAVAENRRSSRVAVSGRMRLLVRIMMGMKCYNQPSWLLFAFKDLEYLILLLS